jgi:hypothetical protein
MDTATAATPKSTTGVLGPSALGWQVGQGRLPEDVRDFVVNYVAVGAGEPAPLAMTRLASMFYVMPGANR